MILKFSIEKTPVNAVADNLRMVTGCNGITSIHYLTSDFKYLF